MLLYLCTSFNQNNKKQTKMKKIILVAVVAGMTALVSCGDGGAEVKRLADSTEAARIADSAAAAAAAAATEATRVADSATAADTAAAVKAREEAAAKAPVKKK